MQKREESIVYPNSRYPDRESNSDLIFRRDLFYPLNYQGNNKTIIVLRLQRYDIFVKRQKLLGIIFQFTFI